MEKFEVAPVDFKGLDYVLDCVYSYVEVGDGFIRSSYRGTHKIINEVTGIEEVQMKCWCSTVLIDRIAGVDLSWSIQSEKWFVGLDIQGATDWQIWFDKRSQALPLFEAAWKAVFGEKEFSKI